MHDIDTENFTLHVGDSKHVLSELPSESVHTVITSPPYYQLRDYGDQTYTTWNADEDCTHEWGPRQPDANPSGLHEGGNELGKEARDRSDIDAGQYCQHCDAWRGQLGLEPSPWMYVRNMVEISREIRRVLRDDGTYWLNIGDSYCAGASGGSSSSDKSYGAEIGGHGHKRSVDDWGHLKPKDLIGVPWRVAFALQEDGWFLRADNVWVKGLSGDKRLGSCMPESPQDRTSSAHEFVFLLSKSKHYFFDIEAIKEKSVSNPGRYDYDFGGKKNQALHEGDNPTAVTGDKDYYPYSRMRDVWLISPQPYPEAHFAVFPRALVRPMVRAGTPEHGVCADCGAPYERVTEKKATGRTRDRNSGGLGAEHRRNPKGLDEVDGDFQEGVATRTVKWEQACDCSTDERDKAVVLDPFLGSGTTAQVALEENRKCVGIDLNEDYGDLIEDRLEGSGLFKVKTLDAWVDD